MLHARDDYNRIQDPAGRIPHNEPVLLIRAQDMIAADVCHDYVARAERANYPRNLVLLVNTQANRMDAWPVKKMADLPERDSKSFALSIPVKFLHYRDKDNPERITLVIQTGDSLLDVTSLAPWKPDERWEPMPETSTVGMVSLYHVSEVPKCSRAK